MRKICFGLAGAVLAAVSVLAITLSAGSQNPQSGNGRIQIFVRIDGTAYDWTEMDFTATSLELSGLDGTQKRFSIESLSGPSQLNVPRSAESQPRFLAAGDSPTGRINEARLTLGAVSLIANTGGSSPRKIPLSASNGSVLLRLGHPLTLGSGETLSFVVPIRLGVDAVLTNSGVLSLAPTLAAEDLLTLPTPDNYLNAGETLEGGLVEAFPELGVQIIRSKAVDQTTGAIRDITLQSNNGALVSFSDLRARNEEKWRSKHGALSPGLVKKLSSLASSDRVKVDIHLQVSGPPTLLTDAKTPQQWDSAHAAFVAARNAATKPLADAVITAITAAGGSVLDAEPAGGVLHIDASRAALEEVVAGLNGVVQVDEKPSKKAILSTNAARDLVQEPLFLAHLLLAGKDLRMALLDDQPCINENHEVFASGFGILFEPPLGGCGGFGIDNHSGHSTAAAAALGSYVPETTAGDTSHCAGCSYERPPGGGTDGLVGLFQGRMFAVDSCSLGPGIAARNPHLASSSCVDYLDGAGPDTSGRYDSDAVVFGDRIFFAIGSGNIGSAPLVGQYQNTAFCYSYNALCVGGYSHNFTIGVDHFSDDVAPHGGGWANFQGREKPDVVGPYNARLPYQSGSVPSNLKNAAWSMWGGTSFATPFVTGTAGLLMANFPEHLTNDPTLTRAVLMASASHSFPGVPPVPNYTDNIDDPAGAGAPRGDRGVDILKNKHFFSQWIDRTLDFNTAGDFKTPITIRVKENDTVRIVMTYDQCPVRLTGVPDTMALDLDMSALDYSLYPAVTVKANNSHVDNTEMLQFKVRRSFDLPVKLRAQFWDPCADGTRKTHLAIAWDVIPG